MQLKPAEIESLGLTASHLDEASVTGQIFEILGRIAKGRLDKYWSDLALDVLQIDAAVKAACGKVRETGERQTVRFFWFCRSMGTHLFDYAHDSSAEWIGSCIKVWGKEPNVQLGIEFNFDMDDYVKRELRYLPERDKRVQVDYTVSVLENS